MINTYTITFSDVAENHKGMQKIGSLVSSGISAESIIDIQSRIHETYPSVQAEVIDLSATPVTSETEANLLIIRNSTDALCKVSADDLYNEQELLEYDKKALMRGKVVNKRARHNICFSSFNQEPDYDNGIGRVVCFDDVPLLNALKNSLVEIAEVPEDLNAEGNKYYNDKCYIGYHGDAERRIVIAVRLGKSMKLAFQWFWGSDTTGVPRVVELNHGDIYIMSEKAVGHDWRKRKIPTLRHSAYY